MRKGTVLFDIKDFLYQGMRGAALEIEEINRRQTANRDVGHLFSPISDARTAAPIELQCLGSGGGYFSAHRGRLLHAVRARTVHDLDIARCIMALAAANGIQSYCVAHVGDMNIFTDMTGRQNATGFDLGFTARLQGVARETGKLVCSEPLLQLWLENAYFRLRDP